jgi:hypothetical protein
MKQQNNRDDYVIDVVPWLKQYDMGFPPHSLRFSSG